MRARTLKVVVQGDPLRDCGDRHDPGHRRPRLSTELSSLLLIVVSLLMGFEDTLPTRLIDDLTNAINHVSCSLIPIGLMSCIL
jgi:hypothetical protein